MYVETPKTFACLFIVIASSQTILFTLLTNLPFISGFDVVEKIFI